MSRILVAFCLFLSLSSQADARFISLKLGIGGAANMPENSDESQTGAKPWVRYYFAAQFQFYFDVTFFNFLEFTLMPMASAGFGRYDYARGGTNVPGLKANIIEQATFYGARIRFRPSGFTPFLGGGGIAGRMQVGHELEEFRVQNGGSDAPNGNEEKQDMMGAYGEIGFDYTWKRFGLRGHILIYRKRTDSFQNMGDNRLTFEGGLVQAGIFWII